MKRLTPRSMTVLLLLTGCGDPSAVAQSKASSSTTTTMATKREAPVPTCRDGQLIVGLTDIQGATGNWVAAYWVANPSSTPCEVSRRVTVKLRDSAGALAETRSLEGGAPTPILLTAHTSLPSPSHNPAQGQQIASIVLVWPTHADPSSPCEPPMFQIGSVQFTFVPGPSIETHETEATGRKLRVCNDDLGGTGPDAVPG